jgi:hypothetical protein
VALALLPSRRQPSPALPSHLQVYAKDFDNVLVVGASDEYDEHAPFSNFDTRAVHLSAPGNW